MGITSVFVNILLIVTSLFSSSPSTNQISLEIETPEVSESQQIIIYNYSTVTYSSPFALDYSEILFGNTYATSETFDKQASNIIQKEPIQQGSIEDKVSTFSFGWIINIEKQCSLPNGAKIEVIADKIYTMSKNSSVLKIEQSNCQNCDITIKLSEYPQSIESAKRLFNEEKINYTHPKGCGIC